MCDLQELYGYLVDDFQIEHCRGFKKKGFTVKTESVSRKKKGKREYLNDAETRLLMNHLHGFFESEVEVPG